MRRTSLHGGLLVFGGDELLEGLLVGRCEALDVLGRDGQAVVVCVHGWTGVFELMWRR